MVSPLFLALFVLAAAAPGARSDDFARRGYLGAEVRPMTDREREKQKLKDENGVIVDRVLSDSSTALAGLQPGDIRHSL
jgi:S1-C subfamily serine protease